MGASGVEIDARSEVRPRDFSQTAIRDLRKRLADLQLSVAAVRFSTRRGYDVEQDLEARVAATMDAMRLAQSLGCNCVVNHVGGAAGEESDEPSAARKRLLSVLADLGAAGRRLGATLLHSAGGESPDTLARLLEELPDGTLGVDFQAGRFAANGYATEPSLAILRAHVLLVHAGDGVRDLAQGRGVEVPLGRGSVDVAALLGGLEEFSYQGWVVVRPVSDTDPAREAADAISYLRAVNE